MVKLVEVKLEGEELGDNEECLLMYSLLCELIKEGWIFENKDIALELCEGYYNVLKEPYCHRCAMPGVKTEECRCRESLYGFSRIYVMGVYYPRRFGKEDLLSKHVLSLKSDKRYAKPLGVALSTIIKNKYPELCSADLITEVPLDREKYLERGFNQSLELAKIVGSQLGIEVKHLLGKNEPFSMKEKSYDERRKLVQGKFQVFSWKKDIVRGKYILLVDDIVTSGFTVSECSKMLIEAGAKRVDVVALARTVPGGYRYV